MPVAPSFDDLIAQHQGEALSIRPTLQFREGDVTLAQEHGSAAMADAAIRYGAQAFKNTFLDGAEGDALTVLVDDHYNIQRSPATASQVDVTFTRPSATAGAGNINAGSVVGSAYDSAGNTVLFTSNALVAFTGADLGPHTVTCTAQVLGRAGNVAAGSVTRIVSTLFDTSIVCTNANPAAGGNDEESDPDLRARARNFWVTLRRGTLASLEYAALLVPAVRVAKATEDPTTGEVTLVIADSDGNSTVQMISDVEKIEEDWRAAGTILQILGGTQLALPVTGTIVFRDGSGGNASVYGPLVAQAITARMAKLRQGEIVYLDAIKAAGIAVDPDIIEAIQLTTPNTDITPTATQTPRAGTVSMS